MVARAKGAQLEYLYCDNLGHIPKSELSKIDDKTKYVLVPYISNGIGSIHDLKSLEEITHAHGAYLPLMGLKPLVIYLLM